MSEPQIVVQLMYKTAKIFWPEMTPEIFNEAFEEVLDETPGEDISAYDLGNKIQEKLTGMFGKPENT